MKRNPDTLSFFEHLYELRGRVIKSVIVFIAASCIFYNFVDPVLQFLIKPVGKLVFTAPADAFVTRINLTMYGGFLLALPFVVYQIWQFVAIGLKETEKKYILWFGPISLVLFFCGTLFAYFVAIPISLHFLLSFATDHIEPMITIKSYISYIGSFILAFGVVFEMPLVLMFLAKIGIATPEFLVQKRRHAIVLILIISAILTPPDVVSQIIMAAPMLILYEISILFCRINFQQSS